MANASSHQPTADALIASLTAELTPVRRLQPPAIRALIWLAVVAAIACGLALFADLPALARRLAATPDMWLSLFGSLSTMILAAFAAFQLSLPDRPLGWALLPLPTALLWLLASGAGCLRAWLIPDTHPATMNEERDCLLFIVGLSVPLSVLLGLMLRRGFCLAPGLTGAMAGLAAAAAAATLLVFVHPFDASATDLAVHAFAVGLVVLIVRFAGARYFAPDTTDALASS